MCLEIAARASARARNRRLCTSSFFSEEALHHRIVPAVALQAQARPHPVGREQGRVVCARMLAVLVRMENNARARPAAPYAILSASITSPGSDDRPCSISWDPAGWPPLESSAYTSRSSVLPLGCSSAHSTTAGQVHRDLADAKGGTALHIARGADHSDAVGLLAEASRARGRAAGQQWQKDLSILHDPRA